MTKKWCNAGTSHIWLRHDRKITPCCALGEPMEFNLDKDGDFLKKMQSSEFIKAIEPLANGPLPKGRCDQCLSQDSATTTENKRSRSVRHKINHFSNPVIGAHGKQNNNPFFLKIDFSNKCNLKCVMCNSKRSTGWVKDEQKLSELGMFPKKAISSYDKLPDKWWLRNSKQWWESVTKVEISGGEPFYEPMLFEFLEFLLSIGRSSINLSIITNLTLYNKNIDTILRKFKNVDLLCSVDAWEQDVYQYSRGGIYTLETIKENIKQLSKVASRLSIVDTIHCTTYDQSKLAKKWIKEQNLDNVYHNVNYVYTPRHLDVRSVLPDSMLETNKDIKIPQSGFKKEKQLQHKFYNWINALDKVRNTNILNIRPEFESWFKEIETWAK